MWQQPVASGSGICTWRAFPCLHLHPLRDAAPGVMPFPVKRELQQWTPTGHAVTQSLRDSFPPGQAWKLTLCFCNSPHPWVSLCTAGKPLESRNPSMAEKSWKMCQHRAAERGIQATSEWDTRGTAGGFLPQDGAQCRLQSISRKLHKHSEHLNLIAEFCTANCASRQISCKVTGKKKSGRWRSWSCLKKYNIRKSDGGRKEPAFVKSEHGNELCGFDFVPLTLFTSSKSASHTEVYF